MSARRERRPSRAQPQDARPPAPRSGTRLLWGLALVFIIAVTYANSLSGPFVFDDFASIRDNPSVHRLWPLSDVLRTPSRGESVAGRPIVNLTLAVNFALGGLDVAGYHLWNVATHVACALLLFALLLACFVLPSIASIVPASAATPVAFAAALLWAVHPLQSEAVDYIVARTESTTALFYLLTMFAAVRAAEGARERMWTAIAVAACALGMASKESMATAPLMVALFDRVFLFASWKDAFRRRWPLYAGLAASWGVLAVLLAGAPRASSAGFVGDLGPGIETGAWTYLLNQSVMILRYLRLVVWPVGLVLDYGTVRALTFGDVWWQFTVVALLCLAALVALVRWPRAGFLAAWVFMTLAPSSSIIPIVTEAGAERRMYLPSMAIILGGVLLCAWAGLKTRPHIRRRIGTSAVAIATLMLCTLTWQRTQEYASRTTIWQTVVDRWPHGRARRNLAAMLYEEGRRDEAIDQLRTATSDNPEAYFDLGAQLFVRGDHSGSITALESFLRLLPGHSKTATARDLIGQGLVAQGKLDAAREQFRALAADYPSYTIALSRQGDVLLTQQRFEEAVPVLQSYTTTEPGNAAGWRNLGVAQASAGRLDDAIAAFSRAVALTPDDGDARRNLANALLDQGQFARAEPHAREAVRLKPRDPAAHDLLGMVLGSLGRRDEAIAQFTTALSIDPGFVDARRHLAIVQAPRN